MKRPNTKLPTDKTVRRDFQTGTVQPGPGMAPAEPPAEDMKGPGASEEFRKPGPVAATERAAGSSPGERPEKSSMARMTDDMLRKEQELARRAAEKADTGRPGGGVGRTDVTGVVPEGIHADPDVTEGHAGYQESGGSEIIPDERFTNEASGEEADDLSGLRVAAIVTDGFEESELIDPVNALQAAGARVEVVSPKPGTVQAFRHHDKSRTVPVDRLMHDARPDDYDALLLPGGALNADALRAVPDARAFVRQFQADGKPMAVICHGPWLLVSAGLVRGRRLTSYHTIQDDIRNAGGEWLDREVIEDGNWVTSRQPSDLPAFNRAMLRLFGRVPAHR